VKTILGQLVVYRYEYTYEYEYDRRDTRRYSA
jgi:hypothetical protein